MREILFRGKTANGEWVYGSLVHSKNIQPAIYFEVGKGSVKTFDFVYVKPETVGRFIERHDKNGKMIFKGDIVEFSYCNNVHKAEVVYNNKTCGFEVRYFTVVGAYGERALHSINFANIENIKVISNIHSNPELLDA